MQYQRLGARQLSALNDSACSLIVDPFVGVNSPKIFYRPPVKNQSKLKQIVQQLVDGKVNEDRALVLLFGRSEAQRKLRQLTECLSISQEQVGQYYKLYLTALKNSQNFKFESCNHDSITSYSDGKRGLRVVATRSFGKNSIIAGLVGVVASTKIVDPSSSVDKKSSKKKKKLDNTSNDSGDQDDDDTQTTSPREGFLLLGPAAFVNHSCQPNASFRRLSDDRIVLSTLRDMQAGSEITVSYGYDYSSEINQDHPCECSGCIPKNKST